MARTLYLLRHAKSSWSNPDLDDFDRPLNPRGKAARGVITEWFADNHVRPSLVICSPSKRTRQTLKPIKRIWDPRPEIVYDERVYESSASTLRDVVRHAAAEHRSILLIGHNPGLQMLALDLIIGGQDHAHRELRTKFPTGAILKLTTDVDSWHRMSGDSFRLDDFVLPRELMAA